MKRFEHFVYGILTHPTRQRVVLFLTLLAFVGSVWMFPSKMVLAKMLPGKSTNTFTITVDLPNGSSVYENDRVNRCITQIVSGEKEVVDIEVFQGMGAPLDYAGLVKGSGVKSGEHVSEIVVNLTDLHQRTERSYAMVHRLRPILQSHCEPLVKGTSIKMVEQPAGPPTQAAIVIELYGNDTLSLRALGETLTQLLKQTPDLVDVDMLHDDLYETYVIKVDALKAMHAGISLEQLHHLLYLSFEGMAISHQNSELSPSQIPIYLVLSEASKRLPSKSIEALRAKLALLDIPNASGQRIPLESVVVIEKESSSPSIISKNLQTMVSIVAEADLVSQVYPLLDARSRIKEALAQRFEIRSAHLFDLELIDKQSRERFELRFDGEMKVTMDTFRDLGGAFIAALVLIFILMVVYYKSFAIAGVVLLGSFLSIIGVIVGHWIMDLLSEGTFFLTATSLIGFISLMGISSRNSLLLIDFSVGLMRKGVEKRHAIAIAAATRAKPIFLTAAAIILASTLLASDPIFGGLGVALIFGTIAAVVASLIVIPVLMDRVKAIA